MSEKTSSRQASLSVTYLVLAISFAVCLITSNIFVPRTWKVWSLPLQLTGAVVIFPISYIINDCLTEVYGYRKTRLVIWITFALSAFVALMSQLVTMLPAPLYEENMQTAESFNLLFGLVPRTTAASLLAFVCGSTVNSWIMSRMKVATRGKGFGARAIVSSLGGEFADSIVFYSLVFIGTMPIMGIVSIMLCQIVVKTLYEVIALPITRMAVKKLKKIEAVDTFDDNISYNPFKIKDI